MGTSGPVFLLFSGYKGSCCRVQPARHVGPVLAVGLTMFYLVDFIRCFRLRLGGMEDEDAPAVAG